MADVWTVKQILDWIEGYLGEKGIDNPRLSAQWLVSEALGCSRLELYTDLDRPLSDAEREILRDYTKRRGQGEPLQYITGTTSFRFATIAVEPSVLIPRPETEVLVSEALAALKELSQDEDGSFTDSSSEEASTSEVMPEDKAFIVVDLCTGSGNIACAIAQELTGATVYASDISPDACALAKRNVEDLGLSERVSVLQGDLGAALPSTIAGQVHLLISNPPYIPSDILSSLDAEVVDFEPELALDGGADGLDFLRRILPLAQDLLGENGVLAVELHETCLETAAQLAQEAGFKDVRIARDLAGKPRVLLASQHN